MEAHQLQLNLSNNKPKNPFGKLDQSFSSASDNSRKTNPRNNLAQLSVYGLACIKSLLSRVSISHSIGFGLVRGAAETEQETSDAQTWAIICSGYFVTLVAAFAISQRRLLF